MSLNARAHQILDRAKHGQPVTRALIDWALRRTGDMPQMARTEA